ncbi:hypothetical protein FACS1894184_14200 [Clostridia bacterium]|nr:hypothetical protein FACS1894184_14200 [Clostridia bacterium]
MDYKPYTDLITPQHRIRPKYFAWVSFLLTLFDVDIARQVGEMFNPHTAVGKTLDVVGEWVGVSRIFPAITPIPGYDSKMTDDIFRRMILAKIVKNNFKGAQGDLPNLWESVFGQDLLAISHDNQDMILDIDLKGDYSPIDTQLVLDGYIVPKPLGVGMFVNMNTLVDSPWIGVGSTVTDSAHIGIHYSRDDPDPFSNTVYAGTAMGIEYGSMAIKPDFTGPDSTRVSVRTGAAPPTVFGSMAIPIRYSESPEVSRVVQYAGVSPPLVSGQVTIPVRASEPFEPTRTTFYTGVCVGSSTLKILIMSGDLPHPYR